MAPSSLHQGFTFRAPSPPVTETHTQTSLLSETSRFLAFLTPFPNPTRLAQPREDHPDPLRPQQHPTPGDQAARACWAPSGWTGT